MASQLRETGHPLTDGALGGRPLFRCPKCSRSKHFDSFSALKEHLNRQHGVGSATMPEDRQSSAASSDEDAGLGKNRPSASLSPTSRSGLSLEGLLEHAQSLEDQLRQAHASASFLDRYRESSQSAVVRLTAELERFKSQYYAAVDSLQHARDDVRELRAGLLQDGDGGARVDRVLRSQCQKLSDEVVQLKGRLRRCETQLDQSRAASRTQDLECTRLKREAIELAKQADQNAEMVDKLEEKLREKER